jgi:hypothetical protein
MMSESQILKAKQVLGKIIHVEENTWLLPSASDENKYHTVVKSDKYECDCMGYQFTENCYHIIAVTMIEMIEDEHTRVQEKYGDETNG